MKDSAPTESRGAPAAPVVSVLMPVHDAASYIGQAIDSILSQTFVDLELIVVDDASTDRSVEVAMSRQDERLRIVPGEHRLGPALTRNRGLEVARGKYLALMDADDRCAPDRLERQLAYLAANPEVAVLGAWAREMDAHGERTTNEYKTPCEPQ